ncbi:MAG TPA: heme biosynthesis HemY N-terminal domain-containing protein [Geminicoccaceae bacterium]|nr:heme biosynthesis HemY N-terminal domain-containing protein [Geminicoccaceae bacterium]
MTRLILFLVVVAALAIGATWLANNPGSATLQWQGWNVEMPFALLVVGVILLAVALTLLFLLLRWLFRVPRRVARSRRESRRRQGYLALSRGLVAAAAGDPAEARAYTKRVERLLDDPAATLLLGAQTAQLEGNEGAARRQFREMLRHPETEFLGLRGMLAVAMKEGDLDEALRLARRAYLRRPQTSWVLDTLFELQARKELWAEARHTVGAMARARVIDRPTANRRRAILYHLEAADERERGRSFEAFELAIKALRLAPDFAPIAVQHAELALEQHNPRRARRGLEACWEAAPHPAVARAYAALRPDERPEERLERFRRLAELRPDHLQSQVTMAEQAMVARRWPAAREYLERALKLEPTARVYRHLAELERAEGGDSERATMWLAKAVEAPPDPAWVCRETGAARATWSAFGPAGHFDSLRWTLPPKVTPMLDEDGLAALLLPGVRPAAAKGDAAAAGGEAGTDGGKLPVKAEVVKREVAVTPRPAEVDAARAAS